MQTQTNWKRQVKKQRNMRLPVRRHLSIKKIEFKGTIVQLIAIKGIEDFSNQYIPALSIQCADGKWQIPKKS